ncbi:CPXCG motif-containing cysteine-rich protein [Neptuniibacter halophilus]|uniref:CPXCG motif-containing cysteine-rich protein n=1 Tax=Neptuniibacter halophilus TaxID=651666 RepID=UPI002572CD62|nr:CPXCG motif-containing cysteine-rich protein [Neptuniibacter halophilus]
MQPIEYLAFACPYCSAENQLAVDTSCDLEQNLTQDCERCCQPVEFRVGLAQGELQLEIRREQE